MANLSEIKKPVFIVVALLTFIAGGVIGYFIGQANGNQAAENKYLPIVNTAFPAPSGKLYSLIGTVKTVYGATITLAVNDPSDYLPHLDGSPRATQTRNANTSPSTQYFSLDNIHLDKSGNPTRATITLADIKSGDTVMVKSSENIFSASSFDATEVDLIK
jgi:ABC-type cobalt transport system substrate-binding protein